MPSITVSLTDVEWAAVAANTNKPVDEYLRWHVRSVVDCCLEHERKKRLDVNTLTAAEIKMVLESRK